MIAAYLSRQRALRERFKNVLYLAVGADNGGHPGIGCAQHHAAGLQSACSRNLQVLRRGQRVAEPGDVGEIDQQSGFRKGADDLFAESVFVADVDGHFLSGDAQRGLVFLAPRETGHRDVAHGEKPGKARRNELAEGNQVRLAVALRR